jgi:hypothetical protein
MTLIILNVHGNESYNFCQSKSKKYLTEKFIDS